MSKKIENTPSPSVLMNSMRAIGYTFKTALADIIDNSISAGANNVFIEVPINDDKLFVSILDDGIGMCKSDLFNAMKYGSNREYGQKDLGRFGLGLKSASLSQCRVLTVASKIENELSAYRWDLDEVIRSGKWECLELDDDEISSLPSINALSSLKMGTLVVWENFDYAFKKNGGRIREYLSDEMYDAERHLRLVFHRFISNKFNPLKIFVNNDLLSPLDPFLEEHPKTDSKSSSEMTIDNSIIKIKPFILPHQNDLSNDDIEKMGGIESFRTGQGFYIYRNDRLIIYGTWFRLSSHSISPELMKYGRIRVDIPNTLDDIWEIDIKKQSATIPKQILNNLKKAVQDVSTRSKEKTSKRAKLSLEKDETKIWNKGLSKSEKDTYFINKESTFVKKFIDEFDDKDKIKILNFLDIISSTIPFDDIYNSICNKRNETIVSDDQIEAIVAEGFAQFMNIKKISKKSNEDVIAILEKYEPFNDEKIKHKIWEMVLNEK